MPEGIHIEDLTRTSCHALVSQLTPLTELIGVHSKNLFNQVSILSGYTNLQILLIVFIMVNMINWWVGLVPVFNFQKVEGMPMDVGYTGWVRSRLR